MHIATPSLRHRRAAVCAALRWVLLLVLAFDLGSAPLHRHHHAGGIEGLTQSALAVSTAVSADAGVDHRADFTHGTAVLRAQERTPDDAVVAVAPEPTRDDASPAGLRSGVPPAAGTLDLAPSFADAPDARVALHRSLPPEGHAPPAHA